MDSSNRPFRSGPTRRDIVLAGATGTLSALVAPGSAMLALAETASTTAVPQVPPPSAAGARAAVAEVEQAILRISREVWENAELSRQEMKSHAIHLRELEAEGFAITSRNTSGYPTAFIAEWTQGSGGPVIAYLPEYDALPGLGNAAEARPAPGPTGVEVGHACGHNLIGAGCTGAALALKRMMLLDGTAGTIRVHGCASEESQGVKPYMVRDGLFDDVDVALAWHPAPVAATGAVRTAANDGIRVTFRGRTAHAGNTPWDGRSALDAAEVFGHAVDQMREHVLPTARLHYIFEAAGVAPNVVPDFAQVWMMIRDKDRPKVSAMTEWVRQIADGAAMATQTKAEFDLFFGVWDLLPNSALINGIHAHMSAEGLDWTDDEQDFARACQAQMGLPEKGMAKQVLPILGEITAGGSTDVGDISWVVPTGLFGWPTLPLGVSLHTWPVTACGGMSIGDKASLATARILAGAGHDLMTQPDLRSAAKADFIAAKGDTVFVSALAADKMPEILPAFMHKGVGDDTMTPPES
ncbi:MAG: amidohydrolase [Rhodobacterales bacterium]|nr:amidohydrolase [Rhodobacterales bacterium]